METRDKLLPGPRVTDAEFLICKQAARLNNRKLSDWMRITLIEVAKELLKK